MLELLPVNASDGTFNLIGRTRETYAPLFLSIQGNGRVIPFKNGQILTVGHNYEMTGVPNLGYEFAYWSPVSVFTDSEVIYNANDVPVETNNTLTISVVPQEIQHRSLEFTMQPVQVLLDIPGVRSLTLRRGWQATFVKRR
jgi:hypothetical protein